MSETRTIKTDYLARVEGEGAMYVKLEDDEITKLELKIYEPPRFFEAFLRGRHFTEAPDITARICGICPVAYQMSAVQAMEDACAVEIPEEIRLLRRLLYCGEWLQSHALHVYLLHAPDFLGYESAVHMARDHASIVERGLQMKKVGNEVMRAVGGREVHPINVRVGGFYRAPSRSELVALISGLEAALQAAYETTTWAGALEFPELEQDYEFVALSSPGQYPIDSGRIVSNLGLDISPTEWNDHFVEEHVSRSNALHSRLRERGAYLVGPLARYSLEGHRLSTAAKDAATEAGLAAPCRNPFKSIVVRSVEMVYACDEALRIVRDYEPPAQPFVDVRPRRGVGHGCTEAPRGALYHRYEIDDEGAILDAQIVPPTSQNQKMIEADLFDVVRRYTALPDDELTLRCEQTIRNYDPCISCATHFLDLEIERE